MKILLSLFSTLLFLSANAQLGDTLYGLARSNNPAAVYLAKMDPATATVSNYSTTSLSTVINLTGSAMNAYDNTYHYTTLDEILTVDLATGALTNSATIVNPIANSFFDNYRFNNADSLLYGLARRYIAATQTGELYLSTINTQTGVVTQISPSSVGQAIALEGSAIDPYQMVYYYTDGQNLIGLDMYNGSIYSSMPMTFPGGGQFFGNMAYSCVDTTLYGLVRENFYGPNQTFDSAHVYLATIDPATGVVTNISTSNVSPSGGYSVNASSTVNPSTMEYYFNDGSDFIRVSLTTGAVVNIQSYTHDNGCNYFDMMRIQTNCIEAKAIRLDPATADVSELENTVFTLYPNPAGTFVEIQSSNDIENIEIVDASGQLLYSDSYQPGQRIPVNQFESGMYFVRVYQSNGSISQERFVKE
ncbi:MAG: T9SS type A sorting domain-containing protein [Crocinitomicaceae bacterium]